MLVVSSASSRDELASTSLRCAFAEVFHSRRPFLFPCLIASPRVAATMGACRSVDSPCHPREVDGVDDQNLTPHRVRRTEAFEP